MRSQQDRILITMKQFLLAFALAAVISGAAQAQPALPGYPAIFGDDHTGQDYPGTQRPRRRLTEQFPEGSFPPGYRPTPLQEMLARNGAAAVDAQQPNNSIARSK